MPEETRVGTITGLTGAMSSGLWILELEETIEGAYPTTVQIPIESGHGVRTLAAAFGAREGSGDLFEKIIGREIEYEVDEVGVLLRFAPVDFADF
jgi:hypothetical protein